jgi:hypothetical protein
MDIRGRWQSANGSRFCISYTSEHLIRGNLFLPGCPEYRRKFKGILYDSGTGGKLFSFFLPHRGRCIGQFLLVQGSVDTGNEMIILRINRYQDKRNNTFGNIREMASLLSQLKAGSDTDIEFDMTSRTGSKMFTLSDSSLHSE